MKKLTGMSNKQIGHLFGGLSYSAVVKVYQRFSADAKTNKLLRKLFKELRADPSPFTDVVAILSLTHNSKSRIDEA